MLTLRIFLSSPGDVDDERETARQVVQALQASHLLREKVRLDLVTWDDPHAATPLEVGVTPQLSVNRYAGRPSECDLTVVVLWSRIGTAPDGLRRADGSAYPSGTVWEMEDALAAGRPVWIYRRTTKPRIDIDDPDIDRKRAQYAAVEALFGRLKGGSGGLPSGINRYDEPAEFGNLLRQQLEAFIGKQLAAPAPEHSGDVERLVGKLMIENQALASERQSLKSRVAELEAQLRAAVTRTLDAASGPGATSQAVEAAAALQRGDTRPAEAALRREEQSAAATAARPETVGEDERAARRQAAQLAREQGALAVGRNARAALAAYQRAAGHEPDDTWTHFLIGDLQRVLGDLAAAYGSYQTGRLAAERRHGANPDDTGARYDLAAAHDRTGDVLMAQGHTRGALAAYRASLTLAEPLAEAEPDNVDWQRSVAIYRGKIGDALAAQGDDDGALAAFRASQAVFERLAEGDPENADSLRDLSITHNKIGNVLLARSDHAAALTVYRRSLEFSERLAARDRANGYWQLDLAISHEKVGDALLAGGDRDGALAAYRRSRGISEKLQRQDANNSDWKRSFAVSDNKIGDALLAASDRAGALAAYRASLTVFQQLAEQDRSHNAWQRDYAAIRFKIAEVLLTTGQAEAALESLRQSLAVFEALAARDPANAERQLDLAECHSRFVSVDSLGAEQRRRHLQQGREILRRLRQEDCLVPAAEWVTRLDLGLADGGATAG